MPGRRSTFAPFAGRSRRTIVAILVTFALCWGLSVVLSISATQGSQHRAAVVEVAARQRTLAERYVNEILLVRAGEPADPAATATVLVRSADALLNGGTAPEVQGDDDATALPAASGSVIRRQLMQEKRLAVDLTAAGSALLAHTSPAAVPMTANEHINVTDPVERLRVLAGLTSNVSLNAARTIATADDANISNLIITQSLLGIGGLSTSLLLALGLIAATRRQTAHFRSLVDSSTDLVLVFGTDGCRYASQSVTRMLGHPDTALLGAGFADVVHPDDRELVRTAATRAEPREIVFGIRNHLGEWRQLEAHLTDLRSDRHIRGIVLNARDVSERVRLEEQLVRQAYHDDLTQLANRVLFRDRLDHALARSERTDAPLAVLLVDLDGFKQVNDSLGHDAGDQLLRRVAERFAEATRPSDTLARFGGDEFGLLVEDADPAHAEAVAGRLLESLSQPLMVSDREFAIGASIGVVHHAGGPGNSDETIRNADIAMYAAKEAGRNRFAVFGEDMARRAIDLRQLEQELRLGLRRGEFSMHYQPEIDLASDAIVGVEALLRWHSPTRGQISPAEFIPVAEATGAIFELGEFVLREACAQTAQWHAAGMLADGFVTWTNLSGRQLSAGGVGALVTRVLGDTGLPAGLLGLEVTETAIVQDGSAGERARAELHDLHESGVRIAIDDFGTGFSSLGQLRHFPVDVIKVDRCFVQGAEHNAKDAAITANVVSLAHALGLLAIAEGIESETQLESVRSVGCDRAQGYLFARPLPAAEATALLAEPRRGDSQAA